MVASSRPATARRRGRARATRPARRRCGASDRRRQARPSRAGPRQSPPATGRGRLAGRDGIRLLMPRARASRRAALPRDARERYRAVRARARGLKRATSDNPRDYRATLRCPGAKSRGTRRAACHHSRLFAAAVPAGRVTGASSSGRPAPRARNRQEPEASAAPPSGKTAGLRGARSPGRRAPRWPAHHFP